MRQRPRLASDDALSQPSSLECESVGAADTDNSEEGEEEDGGSPAWRTIANDGRLARSSGEGSGPPAAGALETGREAARPCGEAATQDGSKRDSDRGSRSEEQARCGGALHPTVTQDLSALPAVALSSIVEMTSRRGECAMRVVCKTYGTRIARARSKHWQRRAQVLPRSDADIRVHVGSLLMLSDEDGLTIAEKNLLVGCEPWAQRGASMALAKLSGRPERGGDDALNTLLKGTRLPEDIARTHAVTALAYVGARHHDVVCACASDMLNADTSASVRGAAMSVLGQIAATGTPRVMSSLLTCLEDDSTCVREMAERHLSRKELCGNMSLIVQMLEILSDSQTRTRETMLKILTFVARDAGLDVNVSGFRNMVACIEDDSIEVRSKACLALARVTRKGDDVACSALATYIAHAGSEVVETAFPALEAVAPPGHAGAVDALFASLASTPPLPRKTLAAAVQCLGIINIPDRRGCSNDTDYTGAINAMVQHGESGHDCEVVLQTLARIARRGDVLACALAAANVGGSAQICSAAMLVLKEVAFRGDSSAVYAVADGLRSHSCSDAVRAAADDCLHTLGFDESRGHALADDPADGPESADLKRASAQHVLGCLRNASPDVTWMSLLQVFERIADFDESENLECLAACGERAAALEYSDIRRNNLEVVLRLLLRIGNRGNASVLRFAKASLSAPSGRSLRVNSYALLTEVAPRGDEGVVQTALGVGMRNRSVGMSLRVNSYALLTEVAPRGDEGVVQTALGDLQDTEWVVQCAAARCLGKVAIKGDRQVIDALRDALQAARERIQGCRDHRHNGCGIEGHNLSALTEALRAVKQMTQ